MSSWVATVALVATLSVFPIITVSFQGNPYAAVYSGFGDDFYDSYFHDSDFYDELYNDYISEWLRYDRMLNDLNYYNDHKYRGNAASDHSDNEEADIERENDAALSDRERFDKERWLKGEDGEDENSLMEKAHESGFGISEESLMKKAESQARINVQRKIQRDLVERLEKQMMGHLDRGMEYSLRQKKPNMRFGEDMDEDHAGRPLEESLDNDGAQEPHDSLSRDESA